MTQPLQFNVGFKPAFVDIRFMTFEDGLVAITDEDGKEVVASIDFTGDNTITFRRLDGHDEQYLVSQWMGRKMYEFAMGLTSGFRDHVDAKVLARSWSKDDEKLMNKHRRRSGRILQWCWDELQKTLSPAWESESTLM